MTTGRERKNDECGMEKKLVGIGQLAMEFDSQVYGCQQGVATGAVPGVCPSLHPPPLGPEGAQ